jgi:hypothetical protein
MDLFRIDVEAEDLKVLFAEAENEGEADVAKPDNADFCPVGDDFFE